MTTKEKIDQAVDRLSQYEQEKILNILELQLKGINIFMLINGRPVLDDEEFSKLDMLPYFQDNWDKEA